MLLVFVLTRFEVCCGCAYQAPAVQLRQRGCCRRQDRAGGLLERHGLINHICSGDVSLVPVLKRDQEVREKELIKEKRRGAEN